MIETMGATPCPVCQMNVEIYQDQINAKYKTKFQIAVVYYSTLMSVPFGKAGKVSGSGRTGDPRQATGSDCR